MTSKKAPEFDIMKVYFELDALCFDTTNGLYTAGLEAHEKLFGKEQVHASLEAADKKRREYMERFRGPVHQIADFAVTSGHEAVAFFAGRLAGFTSVRRRWITEARAEEQDALKSRVLLEQSRAELRLHQSGENFQSAVQDALRGWFENRSWISRSLAQELLPVDGDNRKQGRSDGANPPLPVRLQMDSMPWKILKALAAEGRAIPRQALFDRLAPSGQDRSKEDRKHITTLLSPSGKLVLRKLVKRSGSKVDITPQGAEAVAE